MALLCLPPELLRDIFKRAYPQYWSNGWPRSRPEIQGFMALRLVCKTFNSMVLDRLLDKKVIDGEYFDTPLDLDPPSAPVMRMTHRLLAHEIERDRLLPTESNSSLVAEMVKVIDTAVETLARSDDDDADDRDEIRTAYTNGLLTAVLGYSRNCDLFFHLGMSALDPEDPVSRDHPYLLNMALVAAAALGRLSDMKPPIDKGADALFDDRENEGVDPPLHAAAAGGHT
ncbi:hypothetical protein BJX61DRAFT_547582 [Aspergillus egyptiacus]|nr:hypothetical protein BJX61DRAFT_547582 [Aspergillus egyptiacus]